MSFEKRKRSTSSPPPPHIFRSKPIEDRSSRFIGYFSPTSPPKALQSLPEIQSASHNILAYRRPSNQQSIKAGSKNYIADHDDDGEKYAGKKVASVLEKLNVEGSCVVARWYGGVLLGPVRFEHIENCAREAIKAWREAETQNGVKKLKGEVEAFEGEKLEEERVRLVGVLGRRDASIAVLRGLVVEREDEVKKIKEGGKAGQGGKEAMVEQYEKSEKAVKPTMDYGKLPVEHLRKLEKARDATLSFLLKRIDKAEAELAELMKADVAEVEPP